MKEYNPGDCQDYDSMTFGWVRSQHTVCEQEYMHMCPPPPPPIIDLPASLSMLFIWDIIHFRRQRLFIKIQLHLTK